MKLVCLFPLHSPESPFYLRKSGYHQDDLCAHFRRLNERTKKKLKMTDFRAYVDAKILSKSERNLLQTGDNGDDKLVSSMGLYTARLGFKSQRYQNWLMRSCLYFQLWYSYQRKYPFEESIIRSYFAKRSDQWWYCKFQVKFVNVNRSREGKKLPIPPKNKLMLETNTHM